MKIVYYARICAPLTEEIVLKEGMGGSESALCFSARSLSLQGCDVTVFQPGSQAFEVDGVKFIPLSSFNDSSAKNADIIISFRDIDLCSAQEFRNRKIILWLHDDYSKFWLDFNRINSWFPVINGSISKIFTIGLWQERMLRRMFREKIPPDRFFRTRNGIPFEFEEKPDIERNEHKLIYTSVLNRGFDYLSEIFERLKKHFPKLELVVCTANPEEKDIFLTSSDGIRFLGKLNRVQLRDTLCGTSLLTYPNHPAPFNVGAFGIFAETCCISALEAQACGTPVVTSCRGGLTETVIDGVTGKLVPGDPQSYDGYLDIFAAETAALLNDRGKLSSLRENARKHVMDRYTWKKITHEWTEEFNRLLS